MTNEEAIQSIEAIRQKFLRQCRFKSFPSEWNLPEGEKGGE